MDERVGPTSTSTAATTAIVLLLDIEPTSIITLEPTDMFSPPSPKMTLPIIMMGIDFTDVPNANTTCPALMAAAKTTKHRRAPNWHDERRIDWFRGCAEMDVTAFAGY